MKELLGHASNLVLAPNLDALPKVKARVELILICSEPAYGYGLDGLTHTRQVTDFRLLCGHKALREMAEKLVALAGEAESLEKAMNEKLEA